MPREGMLVMMTNCSVILDWISELMGYRSSVFTFDIFLFFIGTYIWSDALYPSNHAMGNLWFRELILICLSFLTSAPCKYLAICFFLLCSFHLSLHIIWLHNNSLHLYLYNKFFGISIKLIEYFTQITSEVVRKNAETLKNTKKTSETRHSSSNRRNYFAYGS